MTDNWHESLFKGDKGDSLGDGSWGRSSDGPAPVAWDEIPETIKTKKVRARLATPAPGSQKESGLLDIRALAEGMRLDDAGPTLQKKTPPPAQVSGPARLATQAKASSGSGLIDVGELARLQAEELQARADGTASEEPSASDSSVSESSAASSAVGPITSSSLLSSTSLADASVMQTSESSLAEDSIVGPVPGTGNRALMMGIVGLLAVAVAGLAVMVLGGS